MDKNTTFNFDNIVKNYRKIHDLNLIHTGANSVFFSEYKIKELLKYEKNERGTFLDFGCGDGISAIYFRKYFPSWKYYGIDISQKAIDIAKNQNVNNSYFKKFNGLSIPFKPNLFDVVFSACVFHHINIKDHKRVLYNIKNIIKPNGRLYIFEHNLKNPITRRIVKDCIFDQNVKLLSAEYFIKIFKSIGFNDIQIKYTIFFPFYKIFRKLRSLEKYFYRIPFGGQFYIIGKK